ncbi:MAG: Rieske (2Fe-2S) protein [Flavobacteriales bacterium]|nr:Rieske (2Fe-2S) protein [Flavobacteriales bacterium]
MEDNNQKWKEDFPINRQQANQVSRRDFAKLLAFVSGGMAMGNGIIAAKSLLEKPEKGHKRELICDVKDIPVGGTKSFTLSGGKIPYILVHTEEGSFFSYEQKCTHLSCAVYYKPGTGKIECPCHQGYFDVKTGNVLQGPPPRPLKRLDVIVEEDKIYVQSPKEETA